MGRWDCHVYMLRESNNVALPLVKRLISDKEK